VQILHVLRFFCAEILQVIEKAVYLQWITSISFDWAQRFFDDVAPFPFALLSESQYICGELRMAQGVTLEGTLRPFLVELFPFWKQLTADNQRGFLGLLIPIFAVKSQFSGLRVKGMAVCLT
jgi:hypothetical protein